MSFEFETISDILACPECHGQLISVDDGLICGFGEHHLRFPVVDGIPRLLVDEATELSREEWDAVLKQHNAKS